MKYRAEIDGLRAVAVVPVILFHGGFALFSGGFVGVDVFFVISGYLITSILIGEIEAGRFNLINFYERRARRILPALFFVMAACIPFAWLWMAPDQIEDFAQSFVAVVLFASNILFWRESNYFETTSEEKPLLHTWSLAVEEQYYLAFPLFLLFAWRFGRNWVFWSIVVMASASLLLSEWGWRNAPTANFYLAPTRAWELFGGSIAAFLIRKWGVQSRELLAWLGLVLVIGSIFIYDGSTPFPSLYTIAPVAGTALIVMYGSSKTTVGRLLGTRWFVGIGLLSYSAYLWHQPILAFARIQSAEPPSRALIIGLIILTFALAYVSWRYVERPFRNKQKIDRAAVFKLSAVGCASYFLLGIGGILLTPNYQSYWLRSQPENVAKAYELLAEASGGQTMAGDANPQGPSSGTSCRFRVRTFGQATEERLQDCAERFGSGVLVLGDSHASDTFFTILTRFEDDFIFAAAAGDCLPDRRKRECAFDALETFLNQHQGTFRKVIFVSAGFPLLEDTAGRRGTRAIFEHVGSNEPLMGIRPNEDRIANFVAYLDRISESVPVVWFAPRAAPHIAKRRVMVEGCDGSFSYRPHQLEAVSNLTLQIKAQVEAAANPNLSVVSQNDVYAFDLDDDFMNCDDSFWSDGDHFSPAGHTRFGRRLPPDFLD